MRLSCSLPLTLSALLLLPLGGCATADKVLFQSLAGEAPGEPKVEATPVPEVREVEPEAGPPALGASSFRPAPITMPPRSDDAAGGTVLDLAEHLQELERDIGDRDAELQQLRAALAANVEDYGRADGVLRQRANAETWRQATIRLDLVDLEIDRLKALAGKVSTDAGSVEKLAAAIAAAEGLDSVSPEERRRLASLGASAQEMGALLHRMLGEIHQDIGSQASYAARQRQRLAQVGRRLNLEPQSPAPAAAPAAKTPAVAAPNPAAKLRPEKRTQALASAKPPAPQPKPEPRRPLVTIRFTKPQVDFAEPLYEAVNHAVERRPDVAFDVVATGPAAAPGEGLRASGRQRLEEVVSALKQMGVPPERVKAQARASETAERDEVRVFVR